MAYRNHQSGIAIGPILFIVALLGLLAAAIAAGGSSFSGGTATESARAGAAAIIAYGDQLKAAVDRMRYNTEFAETQISFRHNTPMDDGTVALNAYNNTNCSSDACRIFISGGILPKDFIAWGIPNIFGGVGQRAGSLRLRMVQVEGLGSGDNELTVLIAGIRLDVGAEIARRLGQSSTNLSIAGTVLSWEGAVDESWFTTSTRVASGSNVRGREALLQCFVNYCDYYRVLITR